VIEVIPQLVLGAAWWLTLWGCAAFLAAAHPGILLQVGRWAAVVVLAFIVVVAITGFASTAQLHRFASQGATVVMWHAWPVFVVSPVERAIRQRRLGPIGVAVAGVAYGLLMLGASVSGYLNPPSTSGTFLAAALRFRVLHLVFFPSTLVATVLFLAWRLGKYAAAAPWSPPH
jgi:hypothetical protein